MTIQNFNFQSNAVRVMVDEHGKEWFVAKDVAEVLGYAKPENAIARHCKNSITTPKQGGGFMSIIPRPDVFRLITKSKLPAAEAFEKWVFEEVLPSIQKTGAYITPQAAVALLQDPKSMIQILTNFAKEQEERMRLEQENKIKEIRINAMTPKVEYFDRAMSSKRTYTSTEVAKCIGMTAQEFNEWLHRKGYFFKTGKNSTWFPYKEYQNSGLFHLTQRIYNYGKETEGCTLQLRFTAGGKKYFEDYFRTGIKPKVEDYKDVLEPHVKQLGLFNSPKENNSELPGTWEHDLKF